MTELAIVSGSGDLPRILAETMADSGEPYHVVTLANVPIDWVGKHPSISGQVEKIGGLIDDLRAAGCDAVVFAGAMTRPQIDPTALDPLGAQLIQKVLGDSNKTDDQTFRIIIELFETEGFTVKGCTDLLPDLLIPEGPLTARGPDDLERHDATFARNIVTTLGPLDVGQGAVVAGGLCLGIETIQGTDAMLGFVAQTRTGRGGVLVKAPKPSQDLRIDMPVIGVDTVQHAVTAGLGGICVQAEKVIVLDKAAVAAAADEVGLAIWAESW